MKILGIVLVVLGILALIFGGFTYVTNEKVVEIGPVEVRADKQHTVWIPPIAGGAAIVAGLVLVALGGKRQTT